MKKTLDFDSDLASGPSLKRSQSSVKVDETKSLTNSFKRKKSTASIAESKSKLQSLRKSIDDKISQISELQQSKPQLQESTVSERRPLQITPVPKINLQSIGKSIQA